MSNTDQNTNDFMEDRSSRPGGRPNNQGMIQRLKFSIEEFNDSCSSLRCTYMLRKGQENVWLDINLAPEPLADFINAIEDCAKDRNFQPYTIVERRTKERVAHASITVKRGQDNIIVLELESKGNKVELQFLPVDTYTRESNGQELPAMVRSERNARACARIYANYLEVLRERFKPFSNNNGNGFQPRKGNQQYQRPQPQQQYNQQPQQQYQPQRPQAQQAPTTSEDDFFG